MVIDDSVERHKEAKEDAVAIVVREESPVNEERAEMKNAHVCEEFLQVKKWKRKT